VLCLYSHLLGMTRCDCVGWFIFSSTWSPNHSVDLSVVSFSRLNMNSFFVTFTAFSSLACMLVTQRFVCTTEPLAAALHIPGW
jgi:hypothetical protein